MQAAKHRCWRSGRQALHTKGYFVVAFYMYLVASSFVATVLDGSFLFGNSLLLGSSLLLGQGQSVLLLQIFAQQLGMHL